MRMLVVGAAVAVALSCAIRAAEPVRQAGFQGIQQIGLQARSGTAVSVIVWPDGGGLEADPDIGMPAASPADPKVLTSPDRH